MKVDENKGVVGSPVAQRYSIRLLTENFKSNNSFLWRQLTASGTSPNTLFLPPPLSPTLFPSVPSHGIRQIGFRDYFRVATIRELSPVGSNRMPGASTPTVCGSCIPINCLLNLLVPKYRSFDDVHLV